MMRSLKNSRWEKKHTRMLVQITHERIYGYSTAYHE